MAIDSMRLNLECVSGKINPYAAIGGPDMFLSARQWFGRHMVEFVDDMGAFKSSFEKLGSGFQEKGLMILNGFQARVDLIQPIVELFELHIAKHISTHNHCHDRIRGLNKVLFIFLFFVLLFVT